MFPRWFVYLDELRRWSIKMIYIEIGNPLRWWIARYDIPKDNDLVRWFSKVMNQNGLPRSSAKMIYSVIYLHNLPGFSSIVDPERRSSKIMYIPRLFSQMIYLDNLLRGFGKRWAQPEWSNKKIYQDDESRWSAKIINQDYDLPRDG